MKNLEKLLCDLVDVGMVVKEVVNKKYLSAMAKGIGLAGKLDPERDWHQCGVELLDLTNEEKAQLIASLQNKLKVINDEVVEKKICEGFLLFCEMVEYAEEGVGVGKKVSDFVKGV